MRRKPFEMNGEEKKYNEILSLMFEVLGDVIVPAKDIEILGKTENMERNGDDGKTKHCFNRADTFKK